MNFYLGGPSIFRLFFYFLVFVIFFTTPIQARKWDTTGAHRTYLDAYQKYEDLLQASNAPVSEYLNCTRMFRQVYLRDPHYIHSVSAIFNEGILYQKMGDIFSDVEFYRLAIMRFHFLVSDYGGNQNCPEALLRIADIYSSKLHNEIDAAEAKRILRTVYKHHKVQSTAIPRGTDIETPRIQSEPSNQTINTVRKEKLPTVMNIRHWSSKDYSRLVLEMDSIVRYKKEIVNNPNRILFDIMGSKLRNDLFNKAMIIQDKFLKKIRMVQNNSDVVQIVLDFSDFSEYSIFELQNPFRIVIDLHHRPNEQVKITKPITMTASSVNVQPPEFKKHRPPSIENDFKIVPKIVATALHGDVKTNGLNNATAAKLNLPFQNNLTEPLQAAEPTSTGKHTLIRMLGLKIGRIVIDPGHGGHDLGTVGPKGLLEKDLVLSLAFKLKSLLEEKLGAEVVLTRDQDTFVSLEERTEIANRHRADLFISIHANSSNSQSISGVETYYLDFAKSESDRLVAARENSSAGKTISDLENLIKQIAQADKSEESRELASTIQDRLYQEARTIFSTTQDRGVRRAPFVVLIGANMPSILTEVAFISNPQDEIILNEEHNRKHLADALFSGIEDYMKKLGSFPIADRTIQNK